MRTNSHTLFTFTFCQLPLVIVFVIDRLICLFTCYIQCELSFIYAVFLPFFSLSPLTHTHICVYTHTNTYVCTCTYTHFLAHLRSFTWQAPAGIGRRILFHTWLPDSISPISCHFPNLLSKRTQKNLSSFFFVQGQKKKM